MKGSLNFFYFCIMRTYVLGVGVVCVCMSTDAHGVLQRVPYPLELESQMVIELLNMGSRN